MSESGQPYAGLGPDTVLDAIADCGFEPDGKLLALNSFENRVYMVGLDGGDSLVAKFYRAGRWSDAAIGEEHDFTRELAEAELPVVAPLAPQGRSLHRFDGFRFALFPRHGGRAPSLESVDQLEWMGRLIGRIHAIGARKPFQHRGRLDLKSKVTGPAAAAANSGLVPDHLHDNYQSAITQLVGALEDLYDRLPAFSQLRLHGDCHPGNVLWTDRGPHFVDLDDALSGPAIQDLWMLAGDDAALDSLLEGYTQFADIDPRQRELIPALRAMRQVHHGGWIAARWADPAFPRAFPFAAEPRWWQEHIADLQEAAATLDHRHS